MTVEKILGKILNIDSNKINDKTGPHNTEEWDSFNGLMIATEIETTFKVSFSIEEIVAIKNVADIKKALKNQNVKEEAI